MAVQRIQLQPGFDTSRIRNQSVATLINCYAEVQSGRGQFPIVGLPGYRRVSLVSPPIRGMFTAPDGTLYVVGGQTLYSIAASGVATVLNTIPGTDMVEFAANRDQIGICSENRLFVWYPQAFNLVEVTNALASAPNFQGCSSLAVVNGIGIAGVPGTDRFQISAQYDLAAWQANDFATAESFPDVLTAIRVVQGEPWFLGRQSMEAWPNTGAAAFPFERRGLSQDVGLVARDTCLNIGTGLYFLGSRRVGGGLSIFGTGGAYQPERVSDHACERLLDRAVHPDRSYAFTWSIEGHQFYVFTCDAGSIAYDIASGKWHQQGAGVWPFETSPPAGRLRAAAFRGSTALAGDEVGRIVAMDFDVNDEGDGPMVREIVTAPMGAVGRQVIIHAIGLDIAGGLGGLTFDPSLLMMLSRDGGSTYDAPRTGKTGLMGQFRRTVQWNRLGRAREFVARFRMTDAAPFQVTGAWADVEEIRLS